MFAIHNRLKDSQRVPTAACYIKNSLYMQILYEYLRLEICGMALMPGALQGRGRKTQILRSVLPTNNMVF